MKIQGIHENQKKSMEIRGIQYLSQWQVNAGGYFSDSRLAQGPRSRTAQEEAGAQGGLDPDHNYRNEPSPALTKHTSKPHCRI